MKEKSMKKRSTLLRTVALPALVAVSLVACGGDDSANDTTTDATTEMSAPIEITGAWARTSPMMATMGAAYMMIMSMDDDRLVAAAVDSSIAERAEVHEVVMADGSDMSMDMDSDMGMDHSSMDMGSETTMAMSSGEMVMREVEGIDIVGGEMLMMKPGGYHVMLIDLVAPLEIGQTFDVTLTFEKTGDVIVPVEVREDAP
jgi:copper(I)-binding protein